MKVVSTSYVMYWLQNAKGQPSDGCLDSQSVKGTATSGVRGYDAGKQINERKRHIVVDTLDLLLVVTC